MNFDLQQVMADLEAGGVGFNGKKDTMKNIALDNNTTPVLVYEFIRAYKQSESDAQATSLSPEETEAKFFGTGLGKKSITQICEENQRESQAVLDKLGRTSISSANINATDRELANAHNMAAIELLKIAMTS